MSSRAVASRRCAPTRQESLQDPQPLPIRAFDEHLAALFVFIDDEVVEREGAADDFGEGGGVSALLEPLEEGLRLRGQVEVQFDPVAEERTTGRGKSRSEGDVEIGSSIFNCDSIS